MYSCRCRKCCQTSHGSLLEAIAQQSWSAAGCSDWTHLFQRAYDIKVLGYTRWRAWSYAIVNPAEVQSVVQSVISNSQRWLVLPASPDRALCRLFDWMHLNVRYERDEDLYSEKEYIAKPTETLKARAGDCEDHANVIASFALEIGLVPRITLLEGHALCEIYLGKSQGLDKNQVQQTVQQYMARRCQEFGLEFGQWPFSQGKVAEGWLLNGMRWRQVLKRLSVLQIYMSTFQILDDGEECWIVLDDYYSSTFVGDVYGPERLGSMGANQWNTDQIAWVSHYRSEDGEEVRRRVAVTKNMDTGNHG